MKVKSIDIIALSVLVTGVFAASVFLLADGNYFLLAFVYLYAYAGFHIAKKDSRRLFSISLGINFIALAILSAYFYYYHGSYFTVIDQGDDNVFFEAMKELGAAWRRGDYLAHRGYTHYSGYGFVLIGGALEFLLNSFGGITENSIKVLNAAVGALVPVFTYKLALILYKKNVETSPLTTGLLVALFPPLIYYSVVGHRDIWIAFFTIFLFYNLYSGYKGKLIVIFLVIYLAFLFRPYSAYILTVITALYYLISVNYKIKREQRYVIVISSLTVAFIVLLYFGGTYLEKFQKSMGFYEQLVIRTSEPGSIGMYLYTMPTPFSEIARFFYGLFTPVPPINVLRLDTVFLMFGHVFWYYIICVAGYYVISKFKTFRKNRYMLFMLAFIIILLFGISMTSLDFRQKTALYPVGMIFFAHAINKISKRELWHLSIACFVFFGLAFVTYMLIKFI